MKEEIYFTKYLPIEGEIKVGNRVQLKDDGSIITTTIDMPNYLAYQKVKLFLCSRDMQVGDKMCQSDGSGNETCFDSQIDKKAGFMKVIGEISPAAIWVKEGDEFKEDQIQKCILYNDDKPVLPVHWAQSLIQDYCEFRVAYQIKCPTCSTFH